MANIQPRRDAIAVARAAFERAVSVGTVPAETPFSVRVEASGDPNLPQQVVVILPPSVTARIEPIRFRGTVCDTPLVELH